MMSVYKYLLQRILNLVSEPHFFCKEGGNDCFNLSALLLSVMMSVYKYLLQRILNLVSEPDFLIFTERASFRRAICKKARISLICFGMVCTQRQQKGKRPSAMEPAARSLIPNGLSQ